MPFFQRLFSTEIFEIQRFSVNRFDVFLAIWALGSAVYLLLIAWTIFRQGREVRWMKTEDYPQAVKLVEEIELNSNLKCRVLISSEIKTPMLIGYFSPIILLPPLTLTDDDLRYVLLHGEATLLLFKLSLEDHLQKNVAQLLAKPGSVSPIDGLHRLAALL